MITVVIINFYELDPKMCIFQPYTADTKWFGRVEYLSDILYLYAVISLMLLAV